MARDFDGVDDVVYRTSQSQVNADFTMMIWANPDSEGETGVGRLFSLFQSATNRVELAFTSGGTNSPNMVLGLGTQTALAGSNETMPLNQWNHWAIRFRTSDNYKDIVKNGVSLISNTTDPSTGSASASLIIGANSSGGSNAYDGKLAMFMWWNYFLSLDEIKVAMRGRWGHTNTTKLKMFLPLWGNQDPEPDWSGNNLHGTIVGAVRADHPPGISLIGEAPRKVKRTVITGGLVIPVFMNQYRQRVA